MVTVEDIEENLTLIGECLQHVRGLFIRNGNGMVLQDDQVWIEIDSDNVLDVCVGITANQVEVARELARSSSFKKIVFSTSTLRDDVQTGNTGELYITLQGHQVNTSTTPPAYDTKVRYAAYTNQQWGLVAAFAGLTSTDMQKITAEVEGNKPERATGWSSQI